MSVICGVRSPGGARVSLDTLRARAFTTTRYGPDGTTARSMGQVGMVYQAFYTDERSRMDGQPATDDRTLLTFDGRLDNYSEIAQETGMSPNCSDWALVLGAFRKWRADCFAHLIGDWALALWDANEQTLYLARDHAGTRNLFFRMIGDEAVWSTYLEGLLTGHCLPNINREYVARFISFQEANDLSPFETIRPVPPAHYVSIKGNEVKTIAHWTWMPTTRIIHGADSEYEEHFRTLFAQAVARRIGDGTATIAELSGGIDSSAIVCVADSICEALPDKRPLLETLSYYDDTELTWDETPYFSAVEERRQKKGIHIDCSHREPTYEPIASADRFYPYPGGDSASVTYARELEDRLGYGGYRVIISGIGGDELLGGVPTGLPELADHLRAGRFGRLFSRALEWSLAQRRPVWGTLYRTARYAGSLYSSATAENTTTPPWLASEARRSLVEEGAAPWRRRTSLDIPPSTIAHSRVWWALLDTLPHKFPHLAGCYEMRYPYLDRDLVDFLLRVPQEQLLQPGKRRFLMKRALKDFLPTAILNRTSKAVVARGRTIHLRNRQQQIEYLFKSSIAADYGLIDPSGCLRALKNEVAGEAQWLGQLIRTIAIELWLRSLASQADARGGSLRESSEHKNLRPTSTRATKIRPSNQFI